MEIVREMYNHIRLKEYWERESFGSKERKGGRGREGREKGIGKMVKGGERKTDSMVKSHRRVV